MNKEQYNTHYNDLCNSLLKLTDDKVIPYMGWFWRNTDFYNKEITLAFAGADEENYVGVCENNKWGCETRSTTAHEAEQFVFYLDLAHEADTTEEKLKICGELNDWLQTLAY